MSALNIPPAWNVGRGIVWGVTEMGETPSRVVIYFKNRPALWRGIFEAADSRVPKWAALVIGKAAGTRDVWKQLDVQRAGMALVDREHGIVEIWDRRRGTWPQLRRQLLQEGGPR